MTYADKPWLKSYKLGPYKLEHSLAPYPKEPVFKALDNAAEKYPGQTAILFLERKINYRNLKIQTDKLAAALAGLGVEKGDRVCTFLPNCMEFIISDWAILKAGAAIVPTSILRTDEGLVHEAGSSNSRIIICREEHLDRVLGIKELCAFEHIIVTSTKGYDIDKVSAALPRGVYEFRKLIEDNDPTPPQVDIDPVEDLCELAFTGGATGIPKGVMVTHFNRSSCIRMGFPWMLKPLMRGLAGKASVFLSVPLFHSYAHYIEQAAAFLGLRVILMPDPRDTKMLVEYIKRYRPFMIPTVPTQLMRIAQAKIAEAIKKEFGSPVSEGYGLTETSPLTHFNLSGFSKITGFMPREKTGLGVPAPDTECKRGPQIMKGYWPEPGSGLTKDGWLHTGDIATMDEDGYFHMCDRTKDMVNVSGLKVYTTTVDEVLYKHPGVLMAAAFGVPDPKTPGSERVMAVIQLKEEFKGKVTADEIQNFCREHLSPYAVPKFVEFRDELPMTVTEKLFKKALRDEIISKMGKTAPTD
ncbi:MAG: AMP-binding protein [Deltaproteobacteria bacterium]|nr:AMP-binding protein [Deltaproteobacteria bacterium]